MTPAPRGRFCLWPAVHGGHPSLRGVKNLSRGFFVRIGKPRKPLLFLFPRFSGSAVQRFSGDSAAGRHDGGDISLCHVTRFKLLDSGVPDRHAAHSVDPQFGQNARPYRPRLGATEPPDAPPTRFVSKDWGEKR
jgi:hypothetical protein